MYILYIRQTHYIRMYPPLKLASSKLVSPVAGRQSPRWRAPVWCQWGTWRGSQRPPALSSSRGPGESDWSEWLGALSPAEKREKERERGGEGRQYTHVCTCTYVRIYATSFIIACTVEEVNYVVENGVKMVYMYSFPKFQEVWLKNVWNSIVLTTIHNNQDNSVLPWKSAMHLYTNSIRCTTSFFIHSSYNSVLSLSGYPRYVCKSVFRMSFL